MGRKTSFFLFDKFKIVSYAAFLREHFWFMVNWFMTVKTKQDISIYL